MYPAEVEKAILADPDILECAVIGVPDYRWGEVGRAVLVPRPGADVGPEKVLASLADRLARYKIPKSAVLAAEIPRNAAGKILKTRLREEYGMP
ncbi:AMP-binding enzyme [Actinomadura madurae]|uniref:AMP-binding enzyme n=1 Tax=Actinomadura madurae TaxID=1993 RepID=UPI0020D20082|nr:hypothetical protein [Actinomadura madurae]MCQ0012512.1 hypothetical protein [Actinomadura madurae]